jgi:hypothetical protein
MKFHADCLVQIPAAPQWRISSAEAQPSLGKMLVQWLPFRSTLAIRIRPLQSYPFSRRIHERAEELFDVGMTA